MNLKHRCSGKLNMFFKTTFSIPTTLTMKEKQISCKYNFRGLMVKATNQNGFESRWCHIMDEASYYNKRQSKGSQMEHTNEKV